MRFVTICVHLDHKLRFCYILHIYEFSGPVLVLTGFLHARVLFEDVL